MKNCLKCETLFEPTRGYESRTRYCLICRTSQRQESSLGWSRRQSIYKGGISCPQNLSDTERAQWYFDNKTKIEGECFVWQGQLNNQGYGAIYLKRGGKKVTVSAHRFIYLNLIKDVGREPLHHTCANRPCVNPEHLVPTSQAENTLEMLSRRGYEARISLLESRISDLESLLSLQAEVIDLASLNA